MNWKIIRDLKIELSLWSYIQLLLFNLLFVLPKSAIDFKEIFMGMNIDLPTITQKCLMFCGFVENWTILYLPFLIALLAGIWFLGFKQILKMAGKNPDYDDKKYIQYQFKLILAFVAIIICLMFIESMAISAVRAPMLRLVNAVG